MLFHSGFVYCIVRCTINWLLCWQAKMRLRPSEIRFTQDSIYPQFHGRLDVNDTINKVQNDDFNSRQKWPHIFKDIKVYQHVTKEGNYYYSFDNRRLYMYRVLEKRRRCSYINVEPTLVWNSTKFTTKNYGYSIVMRGAQAFDHEFTSLLPPPP